MFWVSDTREERRAKIERFLTMEEAPVAVLLSAMHLEWILRRAILSLSTLPNDEVKKRLDRCSGLWRYEKTWRRLVDGANARPLDEIIQNWEALKADDGWYQLRHELIHGKQGSCGQEYAAEHVKQLLAAADDVDNFCKNEWGADLFKKLRVKKNKKSGGL
jgi:hypothetical protein